MNSSTIEFINQNAGAIQAISTIALVLITTWYAVSTRSMTKLIKAQMTPKIIIENVSMGSAFLEQRFLEQNLDEHSFLDFKLIFDVRNEGNASGSIYKPDIFLSLDGTAHSQRIKPITKTYETYNHEHTGIMETWETRTIDHSRSIFLSGGFSEKVEIEYRLRLKDESSLEFARSVQGNLSRVQYKLITQDNLGREYNIPIIKILKEKDVELV